MTGVSWSRSVDAAAGAAAAGVHPAGDRLGDLAACPFLGLTPYTEDEAEYFFGRDTDRDLVIANLMASRLTVLYGPSGVGKSSLLRAGVLRELRQVSHGGFSYLAVNHAVVAYHASWTEDPLIGLADSLRAALPPDLDTAGLVPPGTPLSAGMLRTVVDRLSTDVYLLCDQFEEVMLYQHGPDAAAFAAALGRIVTQPGLRVGVLIGIREDALAKLDQFTPYVPGILDNYLRLDHLRPEAARHAIEKPVARYNASHGADGPVELDEGLVDELLRQLRTGRVAVTDTGRGGTGRSSTIETPYLQLVMTRLWFAEATAGSRTLRLSTLTGLGGAQGIVRRHLDDVMERLSERQRELAAETLRYLVTPSGSKIANSAEVLAHFVGVADPDELTGVLEALSGGNQRILRPVSAPLDQPGPSRYEVFHDVLGPAVLEWRRRYTAAQEQATAQRDLVQAKERAEEHARSSRHWLRYATAAVLVLLLVVVAGLAAWGTRSVADAELRAKLAEYQYHLQVDPGAALQAALAAYQARPTPAAETAVRTSLAADLNEHILRGHRGTVWNGTFSTDGTRVATGGQDGLTRLSDAVSGRLRHAVPPETPDAPSPVTATAFSPDGSRLAIATTNGRIRIVDAATGAPAPALGASAAPVGVSWVRLDGQDRLLASAYYRPESGERTAALYDPATGRIVAEYGAAAAGGTGGYQASASADGSRVVTVGSDQAVSVWDTATGKRVSRSRVLGAEVRQPRFAAADGERVALLRRGETGLGIWNVVFWDWRKGGAAGAVHEDDWDASEAPSLAVSDDGKYVAAALDKRALVFDAGTGETTVFTAEHPDWVNAVAFSPDARLLVTAGADGEARVWSRDSSAPFRLPGHQGILTDARFSPTDPALVLTTSTDGTARTWRLPDRTVFSSDGGSWTLRARTSPDGRHVLTGQRLGYLMIWPVDGGDVENIIPIPDRYSTLMDAEFTPDGATIVSAFSRAASPLLTRWQSGHSGDDPVELRRSDYYLTTIAVAPDGRTVAGGDWNNTVTIWDLDDGKIVTRLSRQGEGVISGLAYIPHTRLLAAASTDGTVRIWDLDHPDRPPRTMPGDVAILAMAVSADGAHLVTASGDHRLRVWRLADGTRERTFTGPVGTPGHGITFSRDGSLVAVGASDATVHVYRWRQGRELGAIQRHTSAVNTVQFLPDGKILSASDDGTAASYRCDVCQPIEQVVRAARAKDRDRYQG